ncbi:hypothetical protein ACTFIY_000011, partial [Dictyostelium cf. discoideum]
VERNIIADMLSRDTSFTLEWDEEFLEKVNKSYEKVTNKDKILLETIKERENVIEKDGILYFIDPYILIQTECSHLKRLKWDEELPNIQHAINTSISIPQPIYLLEDSSQENILEAQIDQAIQYNNSRGFSFSEKKQIKHIKIRYKRRVEIITKEILNYIIRIVNNKSGTRIIPVDDMKPFIEEDISLFSKRKENKFKPLEEEIEKIMNKRNRKYGSGSRIEYLIRIKNSNEEYDQWVPQHYLDELPEMLNQANQLDEQV